MTDELKTTAPEAAKRAAFQGRAHDLHVRVKPETKQRLTEIAEQQHRSLAAQIECALCEWLDNRKDAA